MRRRQVFQMREKQNSAAVLPSDGISAPEAVPDRSPPPVAEIILQNPKVLRAEYVGREVVFKPHKKTLSLKKNG